KRGRGRRAAVLLQRPIVAICNDPYAASLRTLRPLAELVSYKRAPTGALVARLREVCAAEGLALTGRKLSKLVEAMDGDMRSCLNVLQFGRGAQAAGESAETALSLGEKDTNVNPNVLVGRVFKQPKAVTRTQSFAAVVEAVQMNGEYEKIVTGCFGQYLTMQFADDMMRKPTEAGDWLYMHDRLNTAVYTSQHRDLARYLAFVPGKFHHLFASNAANTVQTYSTGRADFEAAETLRGTRSLARQLLTLAAPTVQQIYKDTLVATELAPYLFRIINPAVNESRGLVGEHAGLAHAVEVMLAFQVRLVQDRLESGGYVYRPEPPVEQLLVLDEAERARASAGKFLVRQRLARECDRELVLRGRAPVAVAGRKRGAEDDERPKATRTGPLSAATNRAERATRAPERATREFFVTRPAAGQENTGGLTSRATREEFRSERERMAWVQFHDGFSNAVRKPIAWNEFWRAL
ncbi:uncharacterized protein V1510DRAFT_410903, partial [Dipodascopsis tothii]|uniref:uncharacterized protein n=1 Tax=Dipodascopsis tothii TaxID=44089 RepID=UPI0034CF58A3